MTDRPVGCALLAVLVAMLVVGCCASWPPVTRAASIGRSSDAERTTTIEPATDEADVEATTLAAAIEEAITPPMTPPINGSEKVPNEVRMNQTCFMKHIAWNVESLQILQKCATVAGSLVLTFLNEGKNKTFGSSMMDYRFPDLMYVYGGFCNHSR